jgi:hypothetical protein
MKSLFQKWKNYSLHEQAIEYKAQIQVPMNLYSKVTNLFPKFLTAGISASLSDRDTNPQ